MGCELNSRRCCIQQPRGTPPSIRTPAGPAPAPCPHPHPTAYPSSRGAPGFSLQPYKRCQPPSEIVSGHRSTKNSRPGLVDHSLSRGLRTAPFALPVSPPHTPAHGKAVRTKNNFLSHREPGVHLDSQVNEGSL